MNTEKKILQVNLLIFFSILSLFIGFYFNEDSSGSGGYIADFNYTWGYVEVLKDTIFALGTQWTVHTPLHYILLSKINLIIESQLTVRIIYCLISLIIPFLFYKCLTIKFRDLNFFNKSIITSIIFILPAFRSAAIWANSHGTALIFFLLFLLYFLKWEKRNENLLSKDIFFQATFLALAVYTRQYYALIYIYLVYFYFKKLKILDFTKIMFFISILTVPGFVHVYFYPKILSGTFDSNIGNTILVNSSIIGFYLIPFYLINFLSEKKLMNIDHFMNNKFIYFFSFFTVIICSLFFDYNYTNGGGFFLKLSILVFDNNYLFLLSSLIGLIIILELILENKENVFLFLIFIFGFSAYIIFQKYYEPMFLFVFLFMMRSKIINKIFKKTNNCYLLYLYFFLYFSSAVLNDYFQFTKFID